MLMLKMLCYMIIIFMLLMIAVNVRAQCERPAVGENRILSEESDQQTFINGSTLTFKCSVGYFPVKGSASRSITCTGTQWSELQLQCKKRSCGNPGEIPNGKYLFPEGVLFGATITVKCNEGFWLVGQPNRNCRETGWDGRPPICEVGKCLKPSSITDGEFAPVKDLYDYGEIVTYSCKRGLELIGNSEIVCSGDGMFQPSPPRCLVVTCERPNIPNAVRIEGKSPPYNYNNFVRYQCDKGYKMEGSDYMTCKEDGWNPRPPNCIVITCLKPPSITNGEYYPVRDLYEYGQTVTYSCRKGFILSGASTIACTEDETFQPSPRCLEVTCDAPYIHNAFVVGKMEPYYRYKMSIQYQCFTGYRMVGFDILTCEEYGWNYRQPKCKIVTCYPPFINNGQLNLLKDLYEYGQTVTYSCNKGFRHKSSSTITCGDDGTFKPSPQCLVVTCLHPPVINNGQLNLLKDFYEYGQTVTYSCNKGFRHQGPSTISCADDGTFQPSPECLEVTCDAPNINNAVIVGKKKPFYKYKMFIQYRCNEGYRLEGSNHLICEENGWNRPPPKCSKINVQ